MYIDAAKSSSSERIKPSSRYGCKRCWRWGNALLIFEPVQFDSCDRAIREVE